MKDRHITLDNPNATDAAVLEALTAEIVSLANRYHDHIAPFAGRHVPAESCLFGDRLDRCARAVQRIAVEEVQS